MDNLLFILACDDLIACQFYARIALTFPFLLRTFGTFCASVHRNNSAHKQPQSAQKHFSTTQTQIVDQV